MKRDWKNYNEELVRRGRILIDPEIFDAQAQNKQTKKLRRPFKYPIALILFILFFKYALRLPRCVLKSQAHLLKI
ncbi:MAG: hypothetical protein N3C57_01280 [Aquificaceae bacterium]|nr:hypothetical protein [Aquificaceae bacterium]